MVMAVDVSGSMGARDVNLAHGTPPTRLDLAKQVFGSFIAMRQDDQIGLLTFAGYALTRAPLTADHTALLTLLETVAIPGTADDGAPASGERGSQPECNCGDEPAGVVSR